MTRRYVDPDSIEGQLQDWDVDDDDRALLEHVLGDDRPQQGLHRGGYRGDDE